jgi:hypothetical protein
MIRSAAALSLAALGSCSFFISGLARDYEPDRPPVCTTSRSAPVADTVGFVAFGLLAARLMTTPDCDTSQSECNGDPAEAVRSVGLVMAVPALVYGIAAMVGWMKTHRCCRAIGQYDAAHPPASPTGRHHSPTSSQSGQWSEPSTPVATEPATPVSPRR